MNLRRKVIVVLVLIFLSISLLAVTTIWLRRQPGCSFGYWLNPDVVCRIVDSRNDGKYLLEYFNSDTNEIRLYVQQNGKDLLIEHPYGKVRGYKEVIDQNIIKFNPNDEETLLVNGEIFPIKPKE